jgi:hypothetical protein
LTTPYRYSAAFLSSTTNPPPVVNAGADGAVTVGSAFARTASETGSGITARQWQIIAGPARVGEVLSTTTAVSFTPTVIGTYTLRYTATNDGGPGVDDVDVVASATTAPVPPGGIDLLVEWWAIPSTGTPYLLFDVLDWTVSIEGGSRGTVAVTYPAAGPLYAALVAATIGADRDLEVEIRINGSTAFALRALLTDSEVDEVAEVKARTFRGPLIGQLMAETVIYNSAAANGEVSFSNLTAGAIVSSLVATAQARGALAGISVASFSSSVDSTGTAWPVTQTLTVSAGGTYLSLLQELEDAGVCEWELTATRSLRLYAPGKMGTDRTATSPPLVLRSGRDITAAPRKHSVSDSVTALLLSGSGGTYTSVTDASAQARRGRRIEGYASAGSINSTAGLAVWGTAQLAQKAIGTVELEHTLVVADPASPRPLLDYGLRDLVYSDTLGTGEAVRIQQIVLQRSGADITSRVVVGNLIAERIARLARQLQRIQNGSAIIGSSSPASIADDNLAPNAPTGLALGTGAVPDGIGGSISAVFATWAAPLTNTDGSVCSDLAGYELRWRFIASGYPTGYNPVAGVTGLQTDFGVGALGVVVGVQVRAYDRAGNRSAFGTEVQITTGKDATPPPTPATPTVLAGLGDAVEVRWNGLGSVGEVMGPDFAYVDVHLSTTNDFTPTTGTRRDQLRGKQAVVINGLTYGSTYYIKLIAYDRTGNASAASAQGAAVPTRLISDDLTDSLVTAAKLGAQAVTTPKIFPEAVITPHLSVAAFFDSELPNASFEDIDLTTSTLPALWTLLSSTGSTPTISRDTTATNVRSGAAALKAALPAASGSALVGSAVLPVKPGELYYLQIPAKASRAVAALRVRAYFSSTTPPNPISGNDFLVGTAPTLATTYPTTPYELNFGVPDLDAGGEPVRYMRIVVVAGLVSGDGAALDVYVDQLRLRKVVGTAEIQDASINNAKIVNATIQAAKIATVSVGSITGGTATFTMLMATGNIRSADSGARWLLDPLGLRFFDGSGNVTLDATVSTGKVGIIGDFTSSVGDDRVVISNISGNPEIQLWRSEDVLAPARITGVGDSAVSSTLLQMRSGPNRDYSPHREGRFTLSYDGGTWEWVDVGGVTGRGGFITIDRQMIDMGVQRGATTSQAPGVINLNLGGFSYFATIKNGSAVSRFYALDGVATMDALASGVITGQMLVRSGGDAEIKHRGDAVLYQCNTSGVATAASVLRIGFNGNGPQLYAPTNDLKLVFQSNDYLFLCNSAGTGRKHLASAYDFSSSRTLKSDIRRAQWAAGSARAALGGFEVAQWVWTTDLDDPAEGVQAVRHTFPVAEDLHDVLPEVVRRDALAPGGYAVDTRDVIGYLLALAQEQDAELRALRELIGA